MEKIKTLLVDCDGVLYDAKHLTYEEMLTACRQAGQELGIQWDHVEEVHADLKAKGIHGWYNTALFFCQRFNVDFNKVAQLMVDYVNYSKIPEDLEVLSLLQKVSQKKTLSLLTNNTRPHVDQVFHQLFHQTLKQTKLQAITVEDTLWNGYFHVKKQPDAFVAWCQKFHSKPQEVLLLDDTASVIESAQNQGVQTIQVIGPNALKQVLKGFL